MPCRFRCAMEQLVNDIVLNVISATPELLRALNPCGNRMYISTGFTLPYRSDVIFSMQPGVRGSIINTRPYVDKSLLRMRRPRPKRGSG